MLLKIDFQCEIPIYLQIKNQIINDMAMGELKAGENLPSVRQLAEDIGINMHTVNKAYTILKNDGFIKLDRRKGALINTLDNRINVDYVNRLKDELTPVIAEAYCRGMQDLEFIELCKDIFNNFKEGVNNGI